MRVVVMGVAGCGKTSLGAALAQRLGVRFVEGDTLHPAANVEKMRNGTPLTDGDRWPWLDRVAAELGADDAVIVSCSALRRAYRDRLRTGDVRFVHLAGSRDVMAERMVRRSAHYMPVSLLDSQFATLEPPGADEAALTLDVTMPLEVMVERVISYLTGQQQ